MAFELLARVHLKRMRLYSQFSSFMLPTIILVKEIIAEISLTDVNINPDTNPTTPVVSHVFCSSCLNASTISGRENHTEVQAHLIKLGQTYRMSLSSQGEG